MAEEIKTTSAGDSVPDKSVVGSSSQGEEQETQGAEERETEADGAIVPDEKMVDENEIDAKPANMSDDEELTKEVEGKTATSVEPGKGEVVEEEGKGEDESEAEMSLNEAEAEDKEKNRKEEGQEVIEEKAEEKLGGEVEEKTEERTEEEVEEKAEKEAEGKEEENVEGKAEEGLSEGEATDQSESEEKEVVAEGEGEKKESAEEETVEERKETKAGSEDAEKENVRESIEEKAEETVEAEGLIEEKVADQSESEEKEVARDGGAEENPEIKTEENLAKEEEEAVVGVEPSLVSSEEIADEKGGGIADEEWISWKSEFVNKFNKRFDRKWIISGIGIVVLIVGLVIFLKVPGLRSTDSGEVKSLKEIAGPVYDMKFFLPLAGGSGETRFVKVTVAIELMDKGFRKEIDKKISNLREEVINLVLTKSPKEVRSSHGKEMLKKAITNSLNKHLSKKCIKATYFTELVVL